MNSLLLSLLLVANVVHVSALKDPAQAGRISSWQVCAKADSPGQRRMYPILVIYADGSFDYVAPCKAA